MFQKKFDVLIAHPPDRVSGVFEAGFIHKFQSGFRVELTGDGT